jgi:hypothetical protein
MKFKIRSIPRFEFELTEAQVSMLVTASALHYDYTCRSLSMERSIVAGSPHGLLVSWHNIQQAAIKYPECGPATLEATWRELDLCLKCMEGPLPGLQYERERVETTLAFNRMMNCWRAYETIAGTIEGETT